MKWFPVNNEGADAWLYVVAILALCVVAAPAHATCGYTGDPNIDNHCAPAPTVTPAAPVVPQVQAQQQSQTAAASSTSGASAQANTSSGATGGSATVNVIGAGGSSGGNARYFALPPAPAVPPALAAGGMVSTYATACGPLVTARAKDVRGVNRGLFRDEEIDLGADVTLVPYLDASGNRQLYEDIEGRAIGRQAIVSTGIIGVSSGFSLGVGFASSSAGNVGGGASGSTQRMVTTIVLVPCERAVIVVAAVPQAAVQIAQPVRKRPIIRRRPTCACKLP